MRNFRQRAAEMRGVSAAAGCAAAAAAGEGEKRPRSPALPLPPSPPLPPPRLRRTVSALSLGSADTEALDCALSALCAPGAVALWGGAAPAAAAAAASPAPGCDATPASSPSGEGRGRGRGRRAALPPVPPPLALPPAALSLSGAEQQAVLRGLVQKLRAMLMQTPEAELLKRSFREHLPAAAAAAALL